MASIAIRKRPKWSRRLKPGAPVCARPMPARLHPSRIRLPGDTVLTPVVIRAVICKLPTDDLAAILEAGHNELDRRYGDPDLELDADFEPEP